MSMVLLNDEDVQGIATAIREKNGSSDTYTINEMADAIMEISGDEGIPLQDIAQKSVSGDIVLKTATSIKQYAFSKYTGITSVSSSTVKTISNYAFVNCTGLVSASFTGLTETISSYTFQACSNLQTVNVRTATTVNGYVFNGCSKLVNLALPRITSATGARLTRSCSLLEKLDLGKCARIDAQGIDYCPKLTTIVLRKTGTITTLNNVNAFVGTPFASGGEGGTIYAPSALIETYKTATNWSTIQGYGTITWVALEGSIYENASVDGGGI